MFYPNKRRFFLIKGTAAVYYGNEKVKTMLQGCYFGEIGCLMGGIRRASIKAESVCELQALSRRNLNILLSEYPDVADELMQVAKNRANTVKSKKSTNFEKNNSPTDDSCRVTGELTSDSDLENKREANNNIPENFLAGVQSSGENIIAEQTYESFQTKSPLKFENTTILHKSHYSEDHVYDSIYFSAQKVNEIINEELVSLASDLESTIAEEIQTFTKSLRPIMRKEKSNKKL